MAFIQIIIVAYKSVVKEKFKIIIICVHAQCKQKQRYYGIEDAGHKSKSGRPVRLYSTSGTSFLLLFQQTYQNIAKHNQFFTGSLNP